MEDGYCPFFGFFGANIQVILKYTDTHIFHGTQTHRKRNFHTFQNWRFEFRRDFTSKEWIFWRDPHRPPGHSFSKPSEPLKIPLLVENGFPILWAIIIIPYINQVGLNPLSIAINSPGYFVHGSSGAAESYPRDPKGLIPCHRSSKECIAGFEAAGRICRAVIAPEFWISWWWCCWCCCCCCFCFCCCFCYRCSFCCFLSFFSTVSLLFVITCFLLFFQMFCKIWKYTFYFQKNTLLRVIPTMTYHGEDHIDTWQVGNNSFQLMHIQRIHLEAAAAAEVAAVDGLGAAGWCCCCGSSSGCFFRFWSCFFSGCSCFSCSCP